MSKYFNRKDKVPFADGTAFLFIEGETLYRVSWAGVTTRCSEVGDWDIQQARNWLSAKDWWYISTAEAKALAPNYFNAKRYIGYANFKDGGFGGTSAFFILEKGKAPTLVARDGSAKQPCGWATKEVAARIKAKTYAEITEANARTLAPAYFGAPAVVAAPKPEPEHVPFPDPYDIVRNESVKPVGARGPLTLDTNEIATVRWLCLNSNGDPRVLALKDKLDQYESND